MLWSIDPQANHDDSDMLKFDSELNLKTNLTKAKWLSNSEILVSTTTGELFLILVKLDS